MEINDNTKSTWLKTENTYSVVPASTKILNDLPLGVYNLIKDDMTGKFYLDKLYDTFEFPFKIYGLEKKFIDHVMRTYDSSDNNLGILLHGVKGTGKTVTAKILAKKMNLPVIIVSKPDKGLSDYLASIESDCILFFDEFEKNFSGSENSGLMLSVMDGVYNTNSRKIFILTTNSININENFLSRPSRIRYKKAFGNLPLETVKEFLDENLKDKSKEGEVISYVNTLANSTIDILKCIVEELNLHQCSVDDIKGFMNLQTAKHFYSAVYCDSCDSKEEFKALLKEAEQAVANGDKDEDGDVYKEIGDYGNLWPTNFSTNTNIRHLVRGDMLDYSEVLDPVDADGIISVEYCGNNRFYKILNLDTRPNLYGIQSLVY